MSEKVFCPPQPLRFWITPAYAGKSGFGSSSSAECWDHPRVCGEKWRIRWKNTQTTGSPPRMRGKAMPRLFLFPFWRITPAYAGKSGGSRPRGGEGEDHPRVCGEKFWALVRAVMALGSPPRVRGKANSACRHQPKQGITPAHAGKRRRCCRYRQVAWDHPRLCGEKLGRVHV